MDPTITTLVSVPAILAVVNLLKDLGLPAKLAPVAAILAAVAFSVAQGQFGDTPLYMQISSGIIMALAAAGVYDTTKTPTETVYVEPEEGNDYVAERSLGFTMATEATPTSADVSHSHSITL